MFKTIVWATDGSEGADRALGFAKDLAASGGAKLVAVHVKELMLGRAAGFPVLADKDQLAAKIHQQVEAAREEGFDAIFDLRTGAAGRAAQLIVDAARTAGADVIVVGTRGHSPVTGLLVGSITQRLLHVAPCPVLAVPPAAALEQPEDAGDPALAAR